MQLDHAAVRSARSTSTDKVAVSWRDALSKDTDEKVERQLFRRYSGARRLGI